MDGVIIDSEPFWREAYMTVLPRYNVQLTEELCLESKGVKVDVVVSNWHKFYNWQPANLEVIEREIINEVLLLVRTKGKPMAGLLELITFLKSKNVKIGLATSSLFSIMDVVLDALHLRPFFDVTHSAEAEKAGKPAPDVYLGTCTRLGVKPEDCIAIEDSVTGIVAAKSAGIYALALPEEAEFDLEKYHIADLKIRSLLEVMELEFFD